MSQESNQIYCKHCGKPIDADSTFCMYCGGAIQIEVKIEVSLPISNTAKEEDSFVRLVDAGAAKASIKLIDFVKQHWKRILIFVFGVGGAAGLVYLGIEEFEYARAMFIVPAILVIIATLYFSCSKSIKLLIPSGIVLLCAYGVYIYDEYDNIYGRDTTFFDTIKREFYWITPNYTIPDHVSYIRGGTFWGCTLIKSITIPSSVTSFRGVFAGCKSLERIRIQNASIWDEVQAAITQSDIQGYRDIRIVINGVHYDWWDNVVGCDKTVIDAIIQDKALSIDSHAFENCKSLTSVTIPDSVTSIGERAFSHCESLTSVTIPDNVTKIGNHVFYWCRSLTSVTIPDSVTSIGDFAFDSCTSLTSITIPDSVTSIGERAFSHCESLTSVTIPNSVTSIGYMAFYYCTSLTSVYCKPTTPPCGDDYMFSYYDSGYRPIGCKIYVPRNSVKAYKSAEGWKDYANYIVGYDF